LLPGLSAERPTGLRLRRRLQRRDADPGGRAQRPLHEGAEAGSPLRGSRTPPDRSAAAPTGRVANARPPSGCRLFLSLTRTALPHPGLDRAAALLAAAFRCRLGPCLPGQLRQPALDPYPADRGQHRAPDGLRPDGGPAPEPVLLAGGAPLPAARAAGLR